MKSLMYYAIQVILVSGILYAYYHFILRNNRFHRYNRFYLLGAVVLSLVVPVMNIPVYFTQAQKDDSTLLQTLTSFSAPSSAEVIVQTGISERSAWLTLENILFLVYAGVMLVLFTRILFSLLRLRRIRYQNPSEKLEYIVFINTDEPGTPFSFFRWLFWNRNIDWQSEKGEQIFQHELFHIEQKHSLDTLFLELVSTLCWFNPFFHLLKKETKAIHEFLADQFAIRENNRWQYAELLLMRAMNTQHSLVNPFFHNQIKRRIAMITTSQKPGMQYLRKLMVLPLIALLTIIFAFSYKTSSGMKKNVSFLATDTVPGKIDKKAFYYDVKNEVIIASDSVIIRGDASKIKPDIKNGLLIINGKETSYTEFLAHTYLAKMIIFYKENDPEAIRLYGEKARNGVTVLTDAKIINTPTKEYYKAELKKTGKTADPDNKIFDRVEVEAAFPGGQEKWKQYLQQQLDENIAAKNKAPKGVYTVIVQFVVKTDGFISDVRTLTKHGYGMEEEAMRVIKKGPKWLPAIQNGKVVNAYRKQPVTFAVGTTPIASTDPGSAEAKFSSAYPDIVKASFPGGEEAWKKFLVKNVRSIVPVNNGAPAGTYNAVVQFRIHQDGTLSDFKPISNHGYGIEQEVERLIKDGPKWIPAAVDGKKADFWIQQPVTFVVSEQAGETVTKPRIPAISVAEIKSANAFELLGLSKETEIVGFMFTTDLENGNIEEAYNTGDQLSAATVRLIAGLQPGRLVTFDQIRIKKDGKEMKLPGRVFRVTN